MARKSGSEEGGENDINVMSMIMSINILIKNSNEISDDQFNVASIKTMKMVNGVNNQ